MQEKPRKNTPSPLLKPKSSSSLPLYVMARQTVEEKPLPERLIFAAPVNFSPKVSLEAFLNQIKVTGKSMCPLINDGDQVDVHWFTPETIEEIDLKKGEIVLIQSLDESWILHRVISSQKDQGFFAIKGDASLAEDHINSSRIWGKVTAIQGKVFKLHWSDSVIAWCSKYYLHRTVFIFSILRRQLLRYG